MNNTKNYFRESEAAGIDNDNFTNPGSGEGFDSGRDFVPPPLTESSPSSDRDTYQPSENNEDNESDFEPPDFSDIQADIQAGQDAGRAALAEFEAVRLKEFQENILGEESLIFDSEYYYQQNPDVAASEVDASVHFDSHGRIEDREYRFLLKDDYTPAPNILAANYNSSNFAANYYSSYDDLSLYNPDNLLFSYRLSNVLHFDRNYYLEQNPDVAVDGVDAGFHFISYGILENREHRYVLYSDLLIWDSTIGSVYSQENLEDSLLNSSGNPTGEEQDFGSSTVTENEFDSQYYLAENPDVAAAGVDPYEHYVSFGQAEGRIPYADFDPTVDRADLTETVFLESNNNFI